MNAALPPAGANASAPASPGIAEAVMGADVIKIFIPLSQERVVLAGFQSEPLPHLVAKAVEILKNLR